MKIYQVANLEVVALQGLNLTVEEGELMGIVGASGSGKSTLMNILGGLDRPTAGRVRVGSHDLLKMPERVRNRYRQEQVGFVWQQSSRNLVPYLNALENVMLPMTLAGRVGASKQKRAEMLLDLVQLSERKRHHLPELSGGEQQRVAIAVSLANNPSLLLADEPTGEVDSGTAQVIYDLFKDLTDELGLTTLIVSHDPAIARHVNRVVAIRDGMLASETRRLRTNGAGGTAADQGGAGVEVEETYDEFVVLDRAGRLQIPKEYLEQFQIRGRAVLDTTDEGILIRPAPGDRADAPEMEAQAGGPGTNHNRGAPGGRRIRSFWRRIRGRKEGDPGTND